MYDTKKKNWYVVQALSGFEHRVIQAIKEQIKLSCMEKLFGKMLVPSESVVEIKSGKRKISENKFFPGYILVQMHMNEQTWYLIRNIHRVIGFVGSNSEQPSCISNEEVENILNRLSKNTNQPTPKVLFEPGETVHIKNGPFVGFNGTVEEIDYEKNRLKILVSIFGRSTPVELDFIHVKKS